MFLCYFFLCFYKSKVRFRYGKGILKLVGGLDLLELLNSLSYTNAICKHRKQIIPHRFFQVWECEFFTVNKCLGIKTRTHPRRVGEEETDYFG